MASKLKIIKVMFNNITYTLQTNIQIYTHFFPSYTVITSICAKTSWSSRSFACIYNLPSANTAQ